VFGTSMGGRRPPRPRFDPSQPHHGSSRHPRALSRLRQATCRAQEFFAEKLAEFTYQVCQTTIKYLGYFHHNRFTQNKDKENQSSTGYLLVSFVHSIGLTRVEGKRNLPKHMYCTSAASSISSAAMCVEKNLEYTTLNFSISQRRNSLKIGDTTKDFIKLKILQRKLSTFTNTQHSRLKLHTRLSLLNHSRLTLHIGLSLP
jgi:hypothetical protein